MMAPKRTDRPSWRAPRHLPNTQWPLLPLRRECKNTSALRYELKLVVIWGVLQVFEPGTTVLNTSHGTCAGPDTALHGVSTQLRAHVLVYAQGEIINSVALVPSEAVQPSRPLGPGERTANPRRGTACLYDAAEVVRRDGKSDHMARFISDTDPSGNDGVSGDALLIADWDLSAVFEGRQKNFKGAGPKLRATLRSAKVEGSGRMTRRLATRNRCVDGGRPHWLSLQEKSSGM